MEFKFNVNEVLKGPIVEISQNLIPPNFHGDRRTLWETVTKVSEIVNALGQASASAQGLNKAVTTADRLRNSDQTVYLLVDKDAKSGKGVVTGMLKTGKKSLYIFDRNGENYQVTPQCILDFYVHESRQRTGLGKQLFEHMLQKENTHPAKLAIDRPSSKLLSFLNKHYNLNDGHHQMNNFVVFDGFFPKASEMNTRESLNSTIGDSESPNKIKLAANGLQPLSSFGRYGAPRPPCSMGQIIHNTTSVQSNEPSGVSQNSTSLQETQVNSYNMDKHPLQRSPNFVDYPKQTNYAARQYQSQPNIQAPQTGFDQNNLQMNQINSQPYLSHVPYQQSGTPCDPQNINAQQPMMQDGQMQQPITMHNQVHFAEPNMQIQQPAVSQYQMQQPMSPRDQLQPGMQQTMQVQQPPVSQYQMQQPTSPRDQLQPGMQQTMQMQQPAVSQYQMQQPTSPRDQLQPGMHQTIQMQQPAVSQYQIQQPMSAGDQMQQPISPHDQMQQPISAHDQIQLSAQQSIPMQQPAVSQYQMQQPMSPRDQIEPVTQQTMQMQQPAVSQYQMQQPMSPRDQIQPATQQTMQMQQPAVSQYQMQQPMSPRDQIQPATQQITLMQQPAVSQYQMQQPMSPRDQIQPATQQTMQMQQPAVSQYQMQQPMSPRDQIQPATQQTMQVQQPAVSQYQMQQPMSPQDQIQLSPQQAMQMQQSAVSQYQMQQPMSPRDQIQLSPQQAMQMQQPAVSQYQIPQPIVQDIQMQQPVVSQHQMLQAVAQGNQIQQSMTPRYYEQMQGTPSNASQYTNLQASPETYQQHRSEPAVQTKRVVPKPRLLKCRLRKGNDGLSPDNYPGTKSDFEEQLFIDPTRGKKNKSQPNIPTKTPTPKSNTMDQRAQVAQQPLLNTTNLPQHVPSIRQPTQPVQTQMNIAQQPRENALYMGDSQHIPPPNTGQPFMKQQPSLQAVQTNADPRKYQYFDANSQAMKTTIAEPQAIPSQPVVQGGNAQQSYNPSGDMPVAQIIPNLPQEIVTKRPVSASVSKAGILSQTRISIIRKNGLNDEDAISPIPTRDQPGQMLSQKGQQLNQVTGEIHKTPTESATQSPKLERPRSLTIQCSEDIENLDVLVAKNGKSEVHFHTNDIENDEEITHNVEELVEDEDDDATDRSKSPNPLTAQGFVDLKFYHSRLW